MEALQMNVEDRRELQEAGPFPCALFTVLLGVVHVISVQDLRPNVLLKGLEEARAVLHVKLNIEEVLLP
eukprot:scaffold2245_cov232-Pinguiococcus_pyrenoidosus.AAC.5